jgi:hypothetical protein
VPRIDQDVALGRDDGARHPKGQRARRASERPDSSHRSPSRRTGPGAGASLQRSDSSSRAAPLGQFLSGQRRDPPTPPRRDRAARITGRIDIGRLLTLRRRGRPAGGYGLLRAGRKTRRREARRQQPRTLSGAQTQVGGQAPLARGPVGRSAGVRGSLLGSLPGSLLDPTREGAETPLPAQPAAQPTEKRP